MSGRTPNIDILADDGIIFTDHYAQPSCTAGRTDVNDPTEDARFGYAVMQIIENTGPLTRNRTEAFDDEVLDATLDYLDRKGMDDKPFFTKFNTTAFLIWSHLQNKYLQ